MPVGPGPRFVIEAVFIVAVALIAAISKLSTVGIVLAIGAAWALVAAVEWTASRRSARPAAVEDAPTSAEERSSLLKRLRDRPRQEIAPPLATEPALSAADSAAQHVRVLAGDKPAATPSVPSAPAAPEQEPAEARPLAEPVEAPLVARAEPELPRPVSAAQAVEPESEPTPASVQESGVPPAEPVVAEAGTVPEPEAEPEREPEPVGSPVPVLAAAPPLAPQPAPLPVAAPPREVATIGPRGPAEWNLWELERLTREHAGSDAFKDEERSYLLIYLREFANADGILPVDFDGLVRDSFGDLVGSH